MWSLAQTDWQCADAGAALGGAVGFGMSPYRQQAFIASIQWGSTHGFYVSPGWSKSSTLMAKVQQHESYQQPAINLIHIESQISIQIDHSLRKHIQCFSVFESIWLILPELL